MLKKVFEIGDTLVIVCKWSSSDRPCVFALLLEISRVLDKRIFVEKMFSRNSRVLTRENVETRWPAPPSNEIVDLLPEADFVFKIHSRKKHWRAG